MAPSLSNVPFEKDVISQSNNKKLHQKPFIMHLKANRVMQQQCFLSFIILLQIR